MICEIEHLNNDFQGIFNYFNLKSRLRDEVKATCSDQSEYPNDLIDENGRSFITKNLPNQYIVIKFKNYRIKPTSYTIKSNEKPADDCHPRNWVLECSINGKSWEVVDVRQKNSDLNGFYFVHNFPISYENNKPFKYFKIRQTGPNWSNNDHLSINRIEIFGEIYE